MARLSSSFRKKNRTARSFRDLYAKLPENIRDLAKLKAVTFNANPEGAGFRLHELRDTRNGSHQQQSFSVTIGGGYRAIYVLDGNIRIWYWIGSHADYDTFTGS